MKYKYGEDLFQHRREVSHQLYAKDRGSSWIVEVKGIGLLLEICTVGRIGEVV